MWVCFPISKVGMTEATEQFCLRITTVILMKALGKYQSSERSGLLLQGESFSESGCALRLPLHAGILATSPHPVPSRPSGPEAFLCIPTHSSGATKFQGRAALKEAIPGQLRAALPSFAIVEWGCPRTPAGDKNDSAGARTGAETRTLG